MGCDGGSIPRRDELVKLKKKAEKVDPAEVERIKWFTCALSTERLKEPIVVCDTGYLYNKEAVINGLLHKNIEEKFSHIRSLKDLITPRFTPNPAYNESTTDTDNSASRSPFICPISQVEVGHAPFAIIRTCGCVLSERALREVPSTTCLQCGKAFTQEDVITINPSPEVRAELRTRMEMRRAQEREKRKEKKDKREEKREKKRDKKERDGEKKEGEIKEKEEKEVKVTNGKEESEKDVSVQDKKGKKREVESSTPIEPPTKTSKLSTTTTTTTTTTTSSSSSSKRPTTTTYTAHVAPQVGGEKDEDKESPATITVAKTAAYSSMFQSNRKKQGANHLFSGIY